MYAHAFLSLLILAAGASPGNFASDDGELTGVMPCTPERANPSRSTSSGSAAQVVKFTCAGADFTAEVRYVDMMTAVLRPRRILGVARDSAFAKGHVVSEKEVTVSGRPGIDVQGTRADGGNVRRLLLLDCDSRRNRLVEATFVANAAGSDARAQAYIDSIAFHSPRTAAPEPPLEAYASSDGELGLRAPCHPEPIRETRGDDKKTVVLGFQCERPDLTVSVSYFDAPRVDGDLGTMLDGWLAGNLAQVKGATFSGVRSVSVSGSPGKEAIVTESDGVTSIVRLVAHRTDTHLRVVTIICKAPSAASLQARRTQAFLDSLSFSKH
jgi:hypothetical protein